MPQIILDGFAVPDVSMDKYACWEEMLSVQADMISGRRVIEQRGKVWKAEQAHDCLDNEILRRILAVLRSGAPFAATVLPDNGGAPVSSVFVTESLTRPTFLTEDNGVPIWHGLAFTIREEEPHG